MFTGTEGVSYHQYQWSVLSAWHKALTNWCQYAAHALHDLDRHPSGTSSRGEWFESGSRYRTSARGRTRTPERPVRSPDGQWRTRAAMGASKMFHLRRHWHRLQLDVKKKRCTIPASRADNQDKRRCTPGPVPALGACTRTRRATASMSMEWCGQ